MTAKALILAGYGLNCEEETLHALEYNGVSGEIVHINDLIEAPQKLETAQILAIPGGFSYGDDTGAGNAYAQKLKLALWEPLKKFVERDTLTIGICNGCQILANLGLVPAFDGDYGDRKVAVTHNLNARYQCRWIDLKVSSNSPWLNNVEHMRIPVAHGEGRFMMSDDTLKALHSNGQIAAQYAFPSHPTPHPQGEGSEAYASQEALATTGEGLALANGQFPFNPNGSVDDIAAITDQSGKVLAIMPHPERGMFTWQRDDYMELKDAAQRSGNALPETADGMQIFQNAAAYFEVAKRKSA